MTFVVVTVIDAGKEKASRCRVRNRWQPTVGSFAVWIIKVFYNHVVSSTVVREFTVDAFRRPIPGIYLHAIVIVYGVRAKIELDLMTLTRPIVGFLWLFFELAKRLVLKALLVVESQQKHSTNRNDNEHSNTTAIVKRAFIVPTAAVVQVV